MVTVTSLMQADGSTRTPARNVWTRRRLWASVVCCVLGVCVTGLLYVSGSGSGPRQSSVRAEKHMLLRSVAQAAAAYQHDAGRQPTLDDLLAAGAIDAEVQRDFALVTPAVDPSSVVEPLPLLVQAVPCRSVRKGEPWGGPGETSNQDYPACRFMLMPDWSVQAIDEPVYQRDYANRVRLVPLW